MIDLGSLRYLLGIEVKKIENGIFISQEKYVLERFKMQNNKPTPTPTRPDIMYVVSLVSRFMETAKETHWSVVDKKNTSGYVFHLGSGAISWASKKQPIASLLTTKDKYVAAIAAMCQGVWMRRMLRDLCHDQEGMKTIFCDNTSTISLSKNLVFHKRTKHIGAKYHFIRELINYDEIALQHCKSQEQFVDIFTKPLARESFVYLKDCLGIFRGGTCY
eukprot:PITA_16665